MVNSETNSQIQHLLFDLLFLIKARMRDIVKDADADLSPLQILILRTLVEEGEMTQQGLGEKIAKDKSQITRLIQELENKKLVIKERNELDGRSFILKPSVDVKNKISFFIKHEKKIVSEMLSGASKSDIKTFERMLILMRNNLHK